MQLPAVEMGPEALLGSQFGVAYATSNLLKMLKYTRWFPLMAKEAAWLNRIFSAVIAFITAIGIHYTFDAVEGTMVITGLTLANIGHGLWAWFIQFALQQFVFKTVVQPEERRQQLAGELPQTSLTRGTGDGN